eukprot:scaffold18290_cov53-Phaeocystis_antarctica.AAC.4
MRTDLGDAPSTRWKYTDPTLREQDTTRAPQRPRRNPPTGHRARPCHRPEFREILFEIWVPSAKFGCLSAAAKVCANFAICIAH